MPFWTYAVRSGVSGSAPTYIRDHKVPLSGKNGPFYKYVSQLITGDEEELYWDMTESQILSELGVEHTENAAIVVDLKPNVKDNVSLFRIRRVWGISHPEWSPIAVQLETLFIDWATTEADKMKMDFKEPENRNLVHEFLYLRGGTSSGGWSWGQVGSVNAALLWPDDFNHFARCIQPYTYLKMR